MKVLVATEKPFAKIAVDGIRKEIEAAGYELVLLEKYISKFENPLDLVYLLFIPVWCSLIRLFTSVV